MSNFFLILLLLILAVVHAASEPLQQIPLSQQQAHEEADSNETLMRESRFDFNIDYRHNSGRFLITEAVDNSKFSAVTGDINFVRGDSLQGPDVVVLVQLSSRSADALDQLYANSLGQELTIASISAIGDGQPAVAVQVAVFIKPGCLQMGIEGTTVDTVNLNIKMWRNLSFETYYMSLTTDHGSITGSELDTFTAHEITVRAKHGHIYGNWSLPAAIRLITWVGNIDIDLIPKRWSAGPHTRGDIHAEANRGDVTIRMPLDRDKLSLRNGSTVIQSVGGVISGTLVHSASTRILSQWYGSIDLILLPYWSFDAWEGVKYNYLRTDQFGAQTNLHILPPVIYDYFPINPLCLMKSYHKTIIGEMHISYPREWCGKLDARAAALPGAQGSSPYIEVRGHDYEVLVEEPLHVVAQRRPLGSQLDIDAVGGAGYLELR